jgi:hypothetical protein
LGRFFDESDVALIQKNGLDRMFVTSGSGSDFQVTRIGSVPQGTSPLVLSRSADMAISITATSEI